MEFTDEEKILQQQAVDFIEAYTQELIDKFVIQKNPLRLGFITIFMAGSPGAGKTEFSQRYMPLILGGGGAQSVVGMLVESGIDIESEDALIVRIDVDEIREFLPQYRKTDQESGIRGNAHIIQTAASKGLDILRDYCFENEVSFLHDGTFANYATMRELVKKSLKGDRAVHIYYLYLDPLAAWEFTKAREYLEGRNIEKEKFIEQFFKSRENVDRIKEEFGDKVKVYCVLKDSKNEVRDIAFVDWPSIDQFLKEQYNKNIIKEYTEEELVNLIV
ncbi:MAG: zeta toxin family protein [bacterium]|nr:zeta toxin family protein [bacterium]